MAKNNFFTHPKLAHSFVNVGVGKARLPTNEMILSVILAGVEQPIYRLPWPQAGQLVVKQSFYKSFLLVRFSVLGLFWQFLPVLNYLLVTTC